MMAVIMDAVSGEAFWRASDHGRKPVTYEGFRVWIWQHERDSNGIWTFKIDGVK